MLAKSRAFQEPSFHPHLQLPKHSSPEIQQIPSQWASSPVPMLNENFILLSNKINFFHTHTQKRNIRCRVNRMHWWDQLLQAQQYKSTLQWHEIMRKIQYLILNPKRWWFGKSFSPIPSGANKCLVVYWLGPSQALINGLIEVSCRFPTSSSQLKFSSKP